MSSGRNIFFFALLAGAYASNPDEDSFRRHLERQINSANGDNWVESKLTSFLAAHTVTRQNYYVFSLIKLPPEDTTYVGFFGSWIRLPSPFAASSPK